MEQESERDCRDARDERNVSMMARTRKRMKEKEKKPRKREDYLPALQDTAPTVRLYTRYPWSEILRVLCIKAREVLVHRQRETHATNLAPAMRGCLCDFSKVTVAANYANTPQRQ